MSFVLKNALKEIGVNYIGNVGHSAKMSASYRNGTMTYCIYLAPWNISGHQVCPKGENCHKSCLNYSGREKISEFSSGRDNRVMRARIAKTNAFYKNRDLFMLTMIHEIKRYMRKAESMNMEFSVRINGTSDLSPILFKDPISGKNILELFPNVQFYDYTKVYNRIKLMEKYPNYDVVFSFDGYNWGECEKFLENGGKVAVVFYGGLPKTFKGWNVVSGNEYDMRYLDPKQTIIGLHYHTTANDYYIDKTTNKRMFREPNTPFVVKV